MLGHPDSSNHLGNSKGVRSSVPEKEQNLICISHYKAQYYGGGGVEWVFLGLESGCSQPALHTPYKESLG